MNNENAAVCVNSIHRELEKQSPEHHVTPEVLFTEILKRLSDIGVNAQDDLGRTPLYYAVSLGDHEKVKQLLKDGADILYVNRNYGSALHVAAGNGDVDMMNILFDAGIGDIIDAVTDGEKISTMYRNSTALFEAVGFYNSSAARYNAKQSEEFFQCMANGLCVIRLLLEHGANPDIRQISKMTALQWAAQAGATEVVKLLLKFNANVNTKAEKGTTLLMSAVTSNGNIEIVRMLVEAGADINIYEKKDQKGHTALTLAAYYGHLDIVQYLLDNGADKSAMSNVITKKGETALDVVKKKKFNDILDILT